MIVWMAAIWVGCASVEKALDMSASDGPGGAELDATANQLRIDIIPGETTPWLDKQSGKRPQWVVIQNKPYLDKFEAPEALDQCIRILSARSMFLAWF